MTHENTGLIHLWVHDECQFYREPTAIGLNVDTSFVTSRSDSYKNKILSNRVLAKIFGLASWVKILFKQCCSCFTAFCPISNRTGFPSESGEESLIAYTPMHLKYPTYLTAIVNLSSLYLKLTLSKPRTHISLRIIKYHYTIVNNTCLTAINSTTTGWIFIGF